MTGKIISMFTGAGGLDLGFEAAGFEVAIAVESDDDCLKTHLREWRPDQRDGFMAPKREVKVNFGRARVGVPRSRYRNR